jgi:hypothetical protein
MRRTPGRTVGGALCPDGLATGGTRPLDAFSQATIKPTRPEAGFHLLPDLRTPIFPLRFLAALVALLGLFSSASAQLVAPPTVDWVSIPGNASVGDTIWTGVWAHANYSDNSDGNDWNADTMPLVLAVNMWVQRPGESGWTQFHGWLDPWATPVEAWGSFTINSGGTHYVKVQVMDGRPWFSDEYVYGIGVNNPAPTITSQLTVSANQGFTTSYTITATNSPTGFSASNLPAGLSFSGDTISGRVTAGTSTVNTTITASNGAGTDTQTLTWDITGAVITPASSVSPTSVVNGGSVTLTRAGSANFGIAWTENVIWRPNGSAHVLGNMQLGSMSYTPTAGPGTYTYQVRIVDTSGYNYVDQWMSFTVTVLPAPTGLTASAVQPTSVTLGWNAVSGATGYNVYRDGVKLNTTPLNGLSYTDATAIGGTAYVYSVKAVDAQGYESAGNLLNVTTPTGASLFEVFLPLP